MFDVWPSIWFNYEVVLPTPSTFSWQQYRLLWLPKQIAYTHVEIFILLHVYPSTKLLKVLLTRFLFCLFQPLASYCRLSRQSWIPSAEQKGRHSSVNILKNFSKYTCSCKIGGSMKYSWADGLNHGAFCFLVAHNWQSTWSCRKIQHVSFKTRSLAIMLRQIRLLVLCATMRSSVMTSGYSTYVSPLSLMPPLFSKYLVRVCSRGWWRWWG